MKTYFWEDFLPPVSAQNITIYTKIRLKSLSVDVRRMQFAFIAQFPREMSQTDRIHPRYFLLRIRVSIRPRYFVNAKKPNTTAAARSMTGQRHRPSDRRNNLNGSFAPSRQVATYVTIALSQAFEKKPLPLALTLLLRYRYRPLLAQGYAILAYTLRVTNASCAKIVSDNRWISSMMKCCDGYINTG